ncbi:hypothetical protein RAB80_014510 [Fusarium oxysporum f. sp. vasinfectum]|nr:hypothetical protein RAB80_014510 [Fusarium oxysporum f. sp. vasinfectum]
MAGNERWFDDIGEGDGGGRSCAAWRPRTGWVWEHGFDIERDGSGRRFWLCKDCHGKKATITHMYDAASTSQANGHMEDVHRINRDGPMSPQRKKQRTLFDMADLDCRRPKDQAVMNAFIASFDPVRFQHLLVRWVACDNVPFNKLESPYFRELMGYANSAIIESGSLPTHTTIRDWIKEIHDEIKLWRSKGPLGKLHNIIHWVQRSGQRIEKLHKLQLIENTALNLEDKTTYNVVTDNATRWNSSEAMMERGYQLRNALDSLVQAEVTEWNNYVARRTQNGTKPMPKKSRTKPAIVDDKMSVEDWSVITEYLAILKPLKIATKRLEGRPKEGKFGAIWEVLLTMEWLLKHLEEFKVQHELDEEPHLRIGCNLGWMKLDRYYTLTEDSPVYLAALILHPAFRWSTVESQWGDHPDWLERGKAAVQELWEEYRNLPVEQETIPEQPTVPRKTTDLDEFMASIRKLSTRPARLPSATRDEYAEWVATTDPGPWWMSGVANPASDVIIVMGDDPDGSGGGYHRPQRKRVRTTKVLEMEQQNGDMEWLEEGETSEGALGQNRTRKQAAPKLAGGMVEAVQSLKQLLEQDLNKKIEAMKAEFQLEFTKLSDRMAEEVARATAQMAQELSQVRDQLTQVCGELEQTRLQLDMLNKAETPRSSDDIHQHVQSIFVCNPIGNSRTGVLHSRHI